MTSPPVQITDVQVIPQGNHRVLYKITDSFGQKYTTRDMWRASLCLRAYETKADVVLESGGGWFYRELQHVTLLDDPLTRPKAPQGVA